jgi:hypothetical protein
LKPSSRIKIGGFEMQPRFPSPSPSTGLHAAGPSPSGPAAIILICGVMACGASFGIAMQISLQSLGLGFEAIRGDVLAHRAATPHFALAWWACWLSALGAFLVGPLCVAAIRAVVACCRLMPGLRLFIAAIAVLALAALAAPRSLPSAPAVAMNSAISLLAAIGSTVLALLGARLLGGIPRDRIARPLEVRLVDRLRRSPDSIPKRATPLRREGSANSGLPLLWTRRRHQRVHRSSWGARAALVTQLVVFAFAPISVLAGSTVLIDLTPGGTAQAWNQLRMTPAHTASDTPSRLQMKLAIDVGDLTVPIATEAPAVPDRVERAASRQQEMSSVSGHGTALSDSELTFTKGYPQRRAAQLAAAMMSPSAIPRRTTGADVTKGEPFGPSFRQGVRNLRPAATSRPHDRQHGHVNDRYAEFRQ